MAGVPRLRGRRSHAAAGVLLVASSGNDASSFVGYPSAHPDVVSVGAVDSSDSVWAEGHGAGSNHGSSLDLVAPGVGIIQETTRFGAYDYIALTGTSMAAPHVSGAAALILSVDPTLTADAVLSILSDTALHPKIPVATVHATPLRGLIRTGSGVCGIG